MISVTLPVPLNTSVKFDGTSSDLAQVFYQRYAMGVERAPMKKRDADLPERIQSRLRAAGSNVTFSALPGMLQMALAWDSGYAFDTKENFVQIWTLGNRSMADIAVSKREIESENTSCTTQNCTQPDGSLSFRNEYCTAENMLHVTKCLITKLIDTSIHKPMWGIGGNSSATPELTVRVHSWTEKTVQNMVYAIHTEKNDIMYGNCPKDGEFDAFVIPCMPDFSDKSMSASASGFSAPPTSDWVDKWLAAISMSMSSASVSADTSEGSSPAPSGAKMKQSSSSSLTLSTGAIVGIIAGALAVVLGVLALVVLRRRRASSSEQPAFIVIEPVDSCALFTPTTIKYVSSTPTRNTCTTESDGRSSTPGCHMEDFGNLDANTPFGALYTDAHLRSRRLDFDKLVFEHELAKGAFGEVWRCRYGRSRVVAVKRLLQSRKRTSEDVHAFIDEIQLTASLQHANILAVIGVAWNRLENLCLVMEYLPRGDLQGHLRSHGASLSWPAHKLPLATGVARALMYLHARSPVLIHRDIKSKNVLLTERLEAKLIDFGASRGMQRDALMAMTAGVGTPYWTAPEVLEGTVYTEQSDIYSFGVLLAELDTCALPYADVRAGASSEPLKAFQILSAVMAGALQPTFTADCPPSVRAVATVCLRLEPARRPTASELVQMLETCMQAGDEQVSVL